MTKSEYNKTLQLYIQKIESMNDEIAFMKYEKKQMEEKVRRATLVIKDLKEAQRTFQLMYGCIYDELEP